MSRPELGGARTWREDRTAVGYALLGTWRKLVDAWSVRSEADAAKLLAQLEQLAKGATVVLTNAHNDMLAAESALETAREELHVQWAQAHTDNCGCDGPYVEADGCDWPPPKSLDGWEPRPKPGRVAEAVPTLVVPAPGGEVRPAAFVDQRRRLHPRGRG